MISGREVGEVGEAGAARRFIGRTAKLVSRPSTSVAAASRHDEVTGELHGVWKTLADVAGKTVEVIGKKVDVVFTFMEMSGASEDARCAHVCVMFTDVVVTFTQQDGMSTPDGGMLTKEEAR